jgi:hypothetical protein
LVLSESEYTGLPDGVFVPITLARDGGAVVFDKHKLVGTEVASWDTGVFVGVSVPMTLARDGSPVLIGSEGMVGTEVSRITGFTVGISVRMAGDVVGDLEQLLPHFANDMSRPLESLQFPVG